MHDAKIKKKRRYTVSVQQKVSNRFGRTQCDTRRRLLLKYKTHNLQYINVSCTVFLLSYLFVPFHFFIFLMEFCAASSVAVRESGRVTRFVEVQDISIRQIEPAFAFLSSPLSFLLGWLLRSAGSLVRDTSASYLARTSPASPPHNTHLTALNSGRLKAETDPNAYHTIFKRFYSERHPPFSTYCYWSAYNLYLFACVLLTQALGKVGFIKCYQH